MCEGNKNRGQHTRAQKHARTTVEKKKRKKRKPGNEMHRNKTNPNKKGQCNQAAENAGKESETRDAKHRAKVKQLPHFPPRARGLRWAEQLVLQQAGCLLVQGPGEKAKQVRP